MRVSILAAGSRGDVQPAAVLGAEMAARGHVVTLGAANDLVAFGDALGLKTVPLGFAARDFLRSPEGMAWLAAGNSREYVVGDLAQKKARSGAIQAALVSACHGSDLIVSGALTMDEAYCIAEAEGIPMVGIHHAPRRSNRHFTAYNVTSRQLPKWLNRATHRVATRAEWKATSTYINEFRSSLGLPEATTPLSARMEAAGAWELQAYSRHMVPELESWSVRRPLTGFITPTESQRAAWAGTDRDASLEEWLATGPPPVFFGFGSMPVADPSDLLALVSAVSRRLGVRCLIGAGWSRITELQREVSSDRIRIVWDIDHAATLPLCQVAVHHGGAGTTAASLAAGTPTVVCSVAFDQPLWGDVVERREVGSHLRFRDITEDSLIGAIEPLLTEGYRHRAESLGVSLRNENATSVSADVLERLGIDKPSATG